ncbi:squalene synthase HpnC [Noviherbaspirillum denitrificans]|uniref:Squalene synthase HpnC n=1 Tax=Noviherbaspirillum denitrificans TaxID=1968433 RepID=A0A254TCA4_9BURK|nr:squalene synthase HpnC [Noviherbaspirillum denitrificans]OWW20274.1 squalene synthase HpnC [Noviherbaspirillum denitrificans]
MPVEHYENFPVASLLLPARLRPAVEAIYAFARSADDLADEGNAPPGERLAALSRYEEALDRIEAGDEVEGAVFANIASVRSQYGLPLRPLRDLISAFKQDVVTTRYAKLEELLDYCSRSASPVGHLMLFLYGTDSPRNLEDSDAICSALQLINFWQDVAIDWRKARIYLPLSDMERFGVTEAHLAEGIVDDAWRKLMRFEVNRARAMMLSGASLAIRLPGRIGWELRLVVQGGLRILERIEMADYDVFRRRPVLGPLDWLCMAWRALSMKIRLARMVHVG